MIDAYLLSLQRKVILSCRWATSFLAFLEFHVDIVEVSRVHTEYTDQILIILPRKLSTVFWPSDPEVFRICNWDLTE